LDRTNRNLLLMSLTLIAAVAIYAAIEWRYFSNFFQGPVAMDAGAIAAVKAPESLPRYFVAVKGDDSIDTGVQDVEEEVSDSGSVRSQTVKAEFSVLRLGSRFLIVKRKPADNGKAYQGALVELPGDVHSQIVTPLLSDNPNAEQIFLPAMLDATGFRKKGYIALAICIPVILFALWNISKAGKRRNNPLTHPILKSLSRYGPLADTACQIDADAAGAPQRVGNALLGPSWILLPSAFSLSVCHIPDVVWAYEKVTKRSVNFIPTGKSYAAIVFDRYGQSLEIQAGREKSEQVLGMLAERAPWAVFGFSDELKKLAGANWAGFVAAVDARRS